MEVLFSWWDYGGDFVSLFGSVKRSYMEDYVFE